MTHQSPLSGSEIVADAVGDVYVRFDAILQSTMRAGILLPLLLLLQSNCVHACDCGPAGPACAYIGRATVAFIGTVEFTDHIESLGLRQRTLVRLRVEEAFKGVSPGVRTVWIDPGSFTSCYAEYPFGTRLLVFGYGGAQIPHDTSMMSVVAGQPNSKPLPSGFDLNTTVYSAPECSGTRTIDTRSNDLRPDLLDLRQFSAGSAVSSIRGRVTVDSDFGIFGFDPIPGLFRAKLTLTGNGLMRTAFTDKGGNYSFPATPPGTYRVESFARTYSPTRGADDVTVPATGCGVADFDMIGSASIEGKLLDSAGAPAANARVEILRLNGKGTPIYYAAKKAMTNAVGDFKFEQLPGGEFQVGVNLFDGPDSKMPFVPTRWSSNGSSTVRVSSGERTVISAFRLPALSEPRHVEVSVQWPDGRPAEGAHVWGEVGGRAATGGDADNTGVARFNALDGVHYRIEANAWIGTAPAREMFHSGSLELTPSGRSVHLNLVLIKDDR